VKISLARKYRRRGRLSALLAKNPVMVLGLDLPFVIACATSLKIAVALSIEMFIIHIVTMIAALILVHALPAWSRILVQVAVSTVTMTLARTLITAMFPDLDNYVGIYIYLMAVNGLTLYQAATVEKKQKPLPVLVTAVLYALAFSLTMLVIALFRELIGNGTLWGIAIPIPYKLDGFLTPFGGFVIMGFALAFFKFLNKRLLVLTIAESIRQDARYTEIRSKGQ
jgi:electron transport complex protein RnfE